VELFFLQKNKKLRRILTPHLTPSNSNSIKNKHFRQVNKRYSNKELIKNCLEGENNP